MGTAVRESRAYLRIDSFHSRRNGRHPSSCRYEKCLDIGPTSARSLHGDARYPDHDQQHAGDEALGRELEAVRDAFVYSGAPFDAAALRAVRERQRTELVAPGERNAKHGAGGLVDIEYWVQAHQIVEGASNPDVRRTNTLEAIAAIGRAGCIGPADAERLAEAYRFLRRLIGALRVVRGNARDLTIPPAGSREFAYLARRLGFAAPEALAAAIEGRMADAAACWERLPGE